MAYIEGHARDQVLLLPASVEDYVSADDPVRFIDAFVEDLDLGVAGFYRSQPISVISLFVAIEHGHTEEEFVAASSSPFLTFGTTVNGLEAGSRILTLRLRTSGIGPPSVQWFKIRLDGVLSEIARS